MLVGAIAFQHTPCVETIRLSRSQKFQSERSFRKGTQRHDLQSLKEALKQNPLDDALHSHNERPSQDFQGLKGFLNQHAEAQPKRDASLKQQRLPKVETSNAESGQDYAAHNQPDAQSSTASSESPQPGSKFTLNINKNVRLSKRRGSRIPARGLDVLDKLMASQGRSSRALIESLQSTVASDDDGRPHSHFREKDTLKVHSEDDASTSFSGKVSRNEIAEGTWGSMSQMLSNFRKVDTWKPMYDNTTDNGATSSTFASSIEKALSPSSAPKASSTTKSTRASSTNVRVLEQNTSTSSSEAYTAKVSDVAKPSLKGQEVLVALQKATIEKAKLKQRTRKTSDRASKSKEVSMRHDSGEWRDAKPIVVKPEWAVQIEELERRIENLKYPMSSS